MKLKLVLLATAVCLCGTSALALTGFLEDQSTNGALTYCSYSNGVIITISSIKLCPLSIN